jgi:hypothetical protein
MLLNNQKNNKWGIMDKFTRKIRYRYFTRLRYCEGVMSNVCLKRREK